MLSNHPPTESHMQQQSLSEQLGAGDQDQTHEEAESIQDLPIEENQLTSTRGNKQ